MVGGRRLGRRLGRRVRALCSGGLQFVSAAPPRPHLHSRRRLGGTKLDHQLLSLAKSVDCHMPACEGSLRKMQARGREEGPSIPPLPLRIEWGMQSRLFLHLVSDSRRSVPQGCRVPTSLWAVHSVRCFSLLTSGLKRGPGSPLGSRRKCSPWGKCTGPDACQRPQLACGCWHASVPVHFFPTGCISHFRRHPGGLEFTLHCCDSPR